MCRESENCFPADLLGAAPGAPFAWHVQHFPTLAAFEAYLAVQTPPAWVEGLTVHHTAVPTLTQWQGRASMAGLERYYRDTKGWPAGPHAFVCAGARNPADDGIWLGTPLYTKGVHAGPCNANRWGVEFVGDFSRTGWSPELEALGLGAVAALLRWKGLSVDTVRGHNECMAGRSCPGGAIAMDAVRAQLHSMLTAPRPAPIRVTGASPILAPPRATMEQAVAYILRRGSAYTPYDIRVICAYYWHYAPLVGVDPLIAIAQCIHETRELQPNGRWWMLSSWWARRPRRNPAGLGVTGHSRTTQPADTKGWTQDGDVWREGYSFATWELAVQAQIGHLLAYAVRPADLTPAQKAMVAKSPRAPKIPQRNRGAAPALNGLNGRWAVPGTTYGLKIAAVANAILKGE
jgi:hypothetical protein